MLTNRLRVRDDRGIKSQTILLLSMLFLANMLVGRAAPLPPLDAYLDCGTPAEAKSQAVPPGQVPAGLSAAEWNNIRGAISDDQYAWTPEGWSTNPAQSWDVRFDQDGILVTSLEGEGWQWGLKLKGYGYNPEDFRSLQDFGSLATDQNTLNYTWDSNISEWWINTPAGLEQGFTLQERPSGSGAVGQPPLVVEMDVTGTLTPLQVGESIHFQNEAGETILIYDKLLVIDAAGNVIPAHFSLRERAGVRENILQILVEDQNAVYPLTIDPWAQSAKLTTSNTAEDPAFFGYSVSIHGDTIVAGAVGSMSTGAAYIFEKPTTGWANMTPTAKLTASDEATDDYFGFAVAIYGDNVVVGANWDDDDGDKSGSAYIFEKPTTGWADMNETAKLTAKDAAAHDNFGTGVAIDGDTVVIGAEGDDDNGDTSGSVYVFEKGTGWSNGSSNQVAKLTASDGDAWDRLGYSVAIYGDTVVAGAKDHDVHGAVYVFEKPGADWSDRTENAKLIAKDKITADEEFGISVAISGDVIVAGARWDDDNGDKSGSTYVFEKDTGWTSGFSNQVAKLTASNGTQDDEFGYAVAIDGDVILVGAWNAPNGDGDDAGSVYTFEKPASGWADMTESDQHNSSDGATGDYFGEALSIDGQTFIAGATYNNSARGAAYVFEFEAPDLVVDKSNDTSDQGVVDTPFDWTINIANLGKQDATFTDGQTIFQDDLPTSGASYGSPTIQNLTDITNGANIDCTITGTTLTCMADGSDVTLEADTGSFDIVFSVTPDTAGSLVNPDSSGVCQVDPDDEINEDDEINNECTDTVTVLDKPDLQVMKANDTGGTEVVGTTFDWTVTISNTGGSDATFTNSQTIFQDDLPNTGASYGTPSAQNFTNISNSGSIDCNIAGTALTCTADGADVILGATTGEFDVVFGVTPDTAGSLVNPDSAGACQVDPDDQIKEDDETNNDCTDTVTVLDRPDLQVLKANDTGGTEVVGTAFDWTITLSNVGASDATFADGQIMFRDDLPSTAASYGTPTVQNVTDITNSGNVDCNIVGTALTCMANGADVTFGAATGSFDVAVEVTPSATVNLNNPDPNGICQVDPDDHVAEGDENDNDCADTVTVTAAGGDGGGDDDDEGSGRPSRNCPVGVPGGICRLKNLVKVVVFENTVSDGSYILIQEKAGGHFQLSGRVFDVTIVGPGGGAIPTFDPPIEVCLRPSNAELKAAGWHYGNLSLFHSHAGGPWEAIYNTYEQDGKVCAKVGQLSLFALGVAPLPDTGFSPGVKHALPAQPAEKAYAASGGFKLEIPSLGIELPIVGVPLTADGWDVRWLEGQAGWLHGTAFPTWTGNTAITAHVWDADNNPGPFVDLNTLQHGDEIIIHAWGLTHTYEVRDVEQVRPDDLRALPHEDYDVLTLLTCQGFDEDVGAYDWRLAVRAVLLGIEAK